MCSRLKDFPPLYLQRTGNQGPALGGFGFTPPSSYTYRTLFGLLYTTGIRIGEAFTLTFKDFPRELDLLYIAEGKFTKARWVPLYSSTSRILGQYIEQNCLYSI